MPTDAKIQLVKETETLFKESKAIYFTKYSDPLQVFQKLTYKKEDKHKIRRS